MILIALPQTGFDPTECITPWMVLKKAGLEVVFTTPDGQPSSADPRMIKEGFGPLSCFLMTHPFILNKYDELICDPSFKSPLAYKEIDVKQFQGLVIPGGHGSKMQSLLNSSELQEKITEFFYQNKPVGAICTGVLAVAKSIFPHNKQSVLYGKKTTAVTKLMELTGWWITYPWLKNYFKVDVLTVQDLICQNLKTNSDFITGPIPFFPMRYSKKHWKRQFVVKDGNYLSARWPGDAYRFSHEFLKMIKEVY